MLLNHKVHFGKNFGICYVKHMYVKKKTINKKMSGVRGVRLEHRNESSLVF